MAIDPRRLRPTELARLLNSTPLGEVISERQLHRHRTRAGFRIGDLLLGVNGIRFGKMTDEEKEKLGKNRTPGKKLTYIVGRAGKEIRLPVTLGTMPDDVIALQIGEHMLQHISQKSDP